MIVGLCLPDQIFASNKNHPDPQHGHTSFSSFQVLHLDVAPSNIILGPDGRGLLVDFHLAQHGTEVKGAGSGRLAFMSVSRLGEGRATLSGESKVLSGSGSIGNRDLHVSIFAISISRMAALRVCHPFHTLALSR
jgi:hypothetical protein